MHFLVKDDFIEFMEKSVETRIYRVDVIKNEKYSNTYTNFEFYKANNNSYCRYFDWFAPFKYFKYKNVCEYIADLVNTSKEYNERFTLTVMPYLWWYLDDYQFTSKDVEKSYELDLCEPFYKFDENDDFEDINWADLSHIYGDEYYLDVDSIIDVILDYVTNDLNQIYNRCLFNYKLSDDRDELDIFYLYSSTINDYLCYELSEALEQVECNIALDKIKKIKELLSEYNSKIEKI